MKTIEVPIDLFYQLKPALDMAILWRKTNASTIEVKPIVKAARIFIERHLLQRKEGDMKP